MEKQVLDGKMQVNEFVQKLDDFSSSLGEREALPFESRKLLKEVASYVEDLKHRLDKRFHKLHKGEIQIVENTKKFYDSFFDCFKDKEGEGVLYLEKMSPKLFCIRKLHQTSIFESINRIIEKKGGVANNEVTSYFRLFLFLDCYESFSDFLSPFLRKLCEKETKHKWNARWSTAETYRTFDLLHPGHIPDPETFDKGYRNLRNRAAHGSFILDEEKRGNVIKHVDNNKIKTANLQETLDTTYKFYLWSILYATEFDLRMLSLCKTAEGESFRICREFLLDYNNTWQKLVAFRKEVGEQEEG